MAKPQVLVFIDWYAPGFKAGGPVRSLVNMVDHLRDRIDFHIVTTDTDYTENMPYPGITPDEWTTMPGGEKVWYASLAGRTPETWKWLLVVERWDVVYINGMWSRKFSIIPLLFAREAKFRRIVAVRGMLASGMMKHGGLKKRLFLMAMKLYGGYKDVEFQATNEEEVEDVKRWIGRDATVHLVPNLARKTNASAPPPREKKPGELRLVSVARIAVEKNTLFAIECLKDAIGDVTFDLFGPIYDHAYWARCEAVIAQLPANIRVRHRGTIDPEKVATLLSGYHALFMPSQGENFGHTMIEALASGLPLLISDRTPWRGLEEKRAGWDLPLDRMDRFTEAIDRIALFDQMEFDGWSQGAFALGARYLNDPAPVQQTLALFTR